MCFYNLPTIAWLTFGVRIYVLVLCKILSIWKKISKIAVNKFYVILFLLFCFFRVYNNNFIKSLYVMNQRNQHYKNLYKSSIVTYNSKVRV